MKNIESNKLSFFSCIGKTHAQGIIVLIFLLISISVYSQGIKSTVEVDTNEILIGDHINLSIFVNSPKENKIFWPHFIDTITKDIEIIEKSLVDTVKNIEDNTYSQRLIITIFDSGFYYIPPVRFYYHRPDDTTLYYFDSDPIPITVNTIEVDT